MYLKGEGADANHTKAVELFELAAKEDHVRALNGLGYVYFNGHVLPQNFVSRFTRPCSLTFVSLAGYDRASTVL